MKTKRILFFVYEGFDLLATTGPIGVFSAANYLKHSPLFETKLISLSGGPVNCNAGIALMTERAMDLSLRKKDTLIIAGASNEETLRTILKDKIVRRWIKEAAPECERYGSVCTGSFLLAAAGLLAGRQAVTHWEGTADLAKYYPDLAVQSDALYVVDGPVWTSAGVTTGVDMALAMLKKDCGSKLMADVAKRLVVYAHRPGNQSQFSAVLDAQMSGQGRFSDIILWIEDHLDAAIKVSDMAEKAGMSERSFYRKFTKATGITPSKYLEKSRLEKAREFLEARQPVKAVYPKVGFKSEAAFRTAFTGKYGIPPSLHQKMHARTK